MPAPDSLYTLLAAVGMSPAVVTETVYALAVQGQVPDAVHIVSTSTGERSVRSQLLGESVFGVPAERVVDRWGPFCRDMLGLAARVPVLFHVATDASGAPLSDVGTIEHDHAFADICYRAVADLTADGMLPVVGSISGGRKTMSAHLMTAFSVYARPCDRLTHVLVTPTSFEADRGFFWPTQETPDAVLHLVEPPFPRLHGVIARGLPGLSDVPRGDLRAVLAALAPLHAAAEDVGRLHLEITHKGIVLSALSPDGNVVGASVTLTPTQAALWLVLRDDLARDGEADPYRHADGSGDDRRARVYKMLSGSDPAKYGRKQITRWVSDLEGVLATVPVIERHAGFATTTLGRAADGTVGKRLRGSGLPLTIGADRAYRTWAACLPHLPVPVSR